MGAPGGRGVSGTVVVVAISLAVLALSVFVAGNAMGLANGHSGGTLAAENTTDVPDEYRPSEHRQLQSSSSSRRRSSPPPSPPASRRRSGTSTGTAVVTGCAPYSTCVPLMIFDARVDPVLIIA